MDSKLLNLFPHLIFLIIESNVKYSFNLSTLKSFIYSFHLHFFHTRFTYSIESLIKDRNIVTDSRIALHSIQRQPIFSPLFVKRCLRVKISTIPDRIHRSVEKVLKSGSNFSMAVSNIVRGTGKQHFVDVSN